MPYQIQKNDAGMFCVHKENADGTAGEVVKCHDTEQGAKDHMAALYANVADANKSIDLDEWTERVRIAFSELFPSSPYQLSDVWCQNVWDDHVRAKVGDNLYSVPYQMNGGDIVFAPASEWTEVEMVETPVTVADDTVVIDGGAVKALGGGKVGGYLVRFTPQGDYDLVEDRFDAKETDLGEPARLPVLYHHGLDQTLKRRRIGAGNTKRDDIGLWIESQLSLRDEYEKAIYQLAEQGKLSWSSGAASHTVERVAEGKGALIKQWFISEASLTPTPAEPRNLAVSVKALPSTNSLKSVDLPEATPEARSAENTAARGDAAAAEPAATAVPSQKNDAGQNPAKVEESKMELTAEQKQALLAELQATNAQQVADAVKTAVEALKAEPPVTPPAGVKTAQVPTLLKMPMGDGVALKAYSPQVLGQFTETDEMKAFTRYLRTGDKGAMKASNAVAMQEDNNAEGGYTVPVGLYQGIIARRNEVSLRARLGLRNIPGKGKTVDVPIDNEADGEFVSTNEEAAMDADSPDINQAAMTLVKYTKKITISWELLNDEDVNLLAFLADWVGRGMAKTENSLILTEVAANGTLFKQFAAAAAFSAGEVEDMIYNSNVSYYLDDGGSNAWVMRPGTYSSLAKLTGNPRLYAEDPQGSNGDKMRPTLLGYPVFFSEKAAATAASAKDIYFGNWYYVGFRESPALTFLRDEYSRADNGQVVLRYYFRQVYKVLQAAAVGYGQHPSA
jgi:HK97 family phage major capsid protein